MRTLQVLLVVGLLVAGEPAAKEQKLSPGQKQALSRVKELGGTFENLLPGEYVEPVFKVDLSFNEFVGDDDLAVLKRLTNLKVLLLSGTAITDRGLEHLKGLPNLSVLVLLRTRVTDRGLAALRECPDLRSLVLYRTGVTDRGLENLKGMVGAHAPTWPSTEPLAMSAE